MAAAAILEADGLGYRYGDGPWALRSVDLAIRPGCRLAVVGANGAGKSTLLLVLDGILRPQEGAIRLEGCPADYGRAGLARWRQLVGLVMQNPDDQLFAPTVYQDVSFGPLNLGLPESAVRERVEEALRALEIWDLRDRPPHLLSLGQRQRAAIAGVLAMRPRVLLMDEPTAWLDPEGTEQFLAMVERVRAGGAAVVIATHDMDLAYLWADEVVVMAGGGVAAHGAPEEVLADEALLLRCRLRLPRLARPARIPGRAADGGCRGAAGSAGPPGAGTAGGAGGWDWAGGSRGSNWAGGAGCSAESTRRERRGGGGERNSCG